MRELWGGLVNLLVGLLLLAAAYYLFGEGL